MAKSKGAKGAKIVRGDPAKSVGGQGKPTGPRDNNPPKKGGGRKK